MTLGLSLSRQGKELQDSGGGELVFADYPLKQAFAPAPMLEDYQQLCYDFIWDHSPKPLINM